LGFIRPRRLHDHAELDIATDEERGDDQCRDELYHVVVSRGEERQVAVYRDGPSQIGRQGLDVAQQPGRQPTFAMQQPASSAG
jgi:hypothetical protein